ADSLLRWAHERTVLYDEFGLDTSQIDEDIDGEDDTE
uniref:Phage tail protein n=2 Tax=Bursaphelenchus xylophilus TaxID=6326 RepID=A0A1I7SP09_BURXY